MLARKISGSGLLFLIFFFVFSILWGDNLSVFLTKVFKGKEKVAVIFTICLISFLSAKAASIVQIIFQTVLEYLKYFIAI